MPRRYHVTGRRYPDPGSLDRIREAAIDWLDADSDDDADYERRRHRLNSAIDARVERLIRERARIQRRRRPMTSDVIQPPLPFRAGT